MKILNVTAGLSTLGFIMSLINLAVIYKTPEGENTYLITTIPTLILIALIFASIAREYKQKRATEPGLTFWQYLKQRRNEDDEE